MVAVHFPKEKCFAYSHWWNSITSKKYGYMWQNVSPKVVPLLLANYSFNDRPIYYFVATVGENGRASVEKKVVYERLPGCSAKTLVPGPSKGMFPYRNALEDGVQKFSKVGIVEIKNIIIAWPKRHYDNRSPPLAVIVEKAVEGEENDTVKHLTSIHPSAYTADYNILSTGEEYTIVAAGMKSYRGIGEWHAITQCGLQIRLGKSLRKIWTEWRTQFLGDQARTNTVDGVEHMTFLAICKRCIRGKHDITCELVV
jgi:hypothetical protein